MNKYIEVLGASPVGAAVQPAAVVVAPHSELAKLKDAFKPGNVVASAVGALVGWKAWKKHPWLGLFTGLNLGSAAYEATLGHDKKRAAVQAGASVVAVVGSKAWKKHPVAGWIIGGLGGSVASDFVVKKVAK